MNHNIIVNHNTKSKLIPISEIFGPTIQGEGALIGRPTIFVRVGGCDFRCAWCDSYYAVDSQYSHTWEKMSCEKIFKHIEDLSHQNAILVTLSGGNPALYDLSELILRATEKNYSFAMETQGSIYKPYFQMLSYLTLSPKPPSAKIENNMDSLDFIIKNMAQSSTHTTLKVAIADETDYLWAKQLHQRYSDIPMYLQPCNIDAKKTDDELQDFPLQHHLNERLKWLISRCQLDHWHNVTLLPQLHVTLWSNERGV